MIDRWVDQSMTTTHPNNAVHSLSIKQIDLNGVTGNLTWIPEEPFAKHKPVVSVGSGLAVPPTQGSVGTAAFLFPEEKGTNVKVNLSKYSSHCTWNTLAKY